MISENITIYNLSRCLSSCLELSQRRGLSLVTDALNGVIRDLEKPMQLAIIGKVSCSKSTLVNAILGKEDIVGTGQMEETFNVSWLKYGSSDGDINVVFKDGKSTLVPRCDWRQWSGQSDDILKEKVKYLEVTYNHEILKHINIIDTPGLDSAKNIDSLNTINFLKDVRPDAVILMFTKGLAQDTLDVVKEFQGSSVNSFSVSPMNAIGLLSKIDFLWHINKDERPVETAQRDIIDGSIYRDFPEVRNSLFSIIPVCAMLASASNAIEHNDIIKIKKLAGTSDDDLREMFHSAGDFSDDYFKTQITIDERKQLYRKFGLYGLYEAVKLERNRNLTIDSLKSLYRQTSGFDRLSMVLYSHFRQRSFLIKTQSAGQIISTACDRQRNMPCDEDTRNAIDRIEDAFLACLMSVFEYKQIDFLTKIYDKTMNITDESAIEEYKRVCGEYGDSAAQKLGLDGTPSPDEMIIMSDERHTGWNSKYLLAYHKSKQTADLYRMLSASYDMLSKDLKEMKKKADEANNILSMVKSFFYGN